MSIFVFAVIGFLIGTIASKTIKGASRAGVIGDLGMAFVGSVVAGGLASLPFGIDTVSTAGVLAAVVGGVLLVGVERFAVGQRTAR
jgi:uncharacterized membrane protein YeaQ/YmgE (transglycosylase-associated protein family)